MSANAYRGTTFLVGPFLGPAIAGYIGAGTNWRESFGILTALYGLSTAMVLLFGRETYYVPGKPTGSRIGSFFGIGNTKLPKWATIADRCRTLVIYVFKFPLFLTGGCCDVSLGDGDAMVNFNDRYRCPGDIYLADR